MKKNFFKLSYHFFLQTAEASRWRVCYQLGLPRLVLKSVAPWRLRVKKFPKMKCSDHRNWCSLKYVLLFCNNKNTHICVANFNFLYFPFFPVKLLVPKSWLCKKNSF